MRDEGSLSMFEILIWTGAGLTLLGLAVLIWCILRVFKAKRANLSDEDLRAAVQKVVPVNLGALLMSVFGLMLVIVGVFLA